MHRITKTFAGAPINLLVNKYLANDEKKTITRIVFLQTYQGPPDLHQLPNKYLG